MIFVLGIELAHVSTAVAVLDLAFDEALELVVARRALKLDHRSTTRYSTSSIENAEQDEKERRNEIDDQKNEKGQVISNTSLTFDLESATL